MSRVPVARRQHFDVGTWCVHQDPSSAGPLAPHPTPPLTPTEPAAAGMLAGAEFGASADGYAAA